MVKKEKQKKSLKLRKRIRKTLGTLCLVSSIVIAGIPVESLEAVEGIDAAKKITLTEEDSKIPDISSAPEYWTGDGIYEFAYVYPKGVNDGDKIAVIISYNSNADTNVGSGILNIPNTVDAYAHYDSRNSTGSGYVAVNSKDQFMFYVAKEPLLDANGNYQYTGTIQAVDEEGNPVVDENGDPVMVPDESTLVTTDKIKPCYYRTFNSWGNQSDDSLFYLTDDADWGSELVSDYTRAVSPDDWRLQDVPVQYINSSDSVTGKGIFEEKGSIMTVNIGDNMRGIGNRAFYGCTSIQSATFGAGLDTIGNYAFANCINMKTVTLPSNTNVRILGDHAFSNCQNLTAYVNPVSVEKIGDFCFENCYNLKTMELNGVDSIPNLNSIGNHAFVNCRSMEKLIIPYNVSEELDISLLEGCSSLKAVTVMNPMAKFVQGLNSVNDGGAYSVKAFKNTVPVEFYFEGEDGSEIHKFCGDYAIAFKYMGQEVYEIIIHQTEGDLTSPKATYRVTSANQLILCDIEEGLSVVDMPDTIGPAKIQEISSTSFQNNCYLEKVYIPSSVLRISDNAFKGCHNLQHVIFNNPVHIESIGLNAFQTQDVAVHKTNCSNPVQAVPSLTFTGPISYDNVPFTYAMDPVNKINVGAQPKTFITYYSGWPSNLTVVYNPDTDKNELTDYPTFADLTSYATKPYVTASEAQSLNTALSNKQAGNKLTQDEEEIINSVLNLELPQGIESVKENLFVVKEGAEITDLSRVGSKTITTQSINEILPKTFNGCKNVESIYINGETYKIGDYAFNDCSSLKNLEISSTVSTLGIRPFSGCDKLSYVSFQGGANFKCDNGIVYSTASDGSKVGIIQCLESRGRAVGSSTIEAAEVAGVQTIAKEAFMECSGLGSVNLQDSAIGEIPERAFKNTGTLYSIYLPDTCKSIWADSFGNSNVRYLEIPSSVAYIDPDAFYTNKNHPDECVNITFFCEDTSNAKVYADIYDNIDVTSKEIVITYTVYFMGMDGSILDKQEVIEGQDAVPPAEELIPVIDGFNFVGWAPSYEAVSGDLNIVAQYEPIDPDSLKVTVNFIDYDDTILKTMLVEVGGDAEAPNVPDREGYRFIGWRPAITGITENTDVYAQYEKMDSDEFKFDVTFLDYDDTVLKVDRVAVGGTAQPPNNPSREGYIFTGWRPDYSNITGDLTVYAQYEKVDSEENKFIVRFIDYNDAILHTQKVDPGADAITPQSPVREGYIFTGWRPAITNITKDLDTYAQYEKIPEPTATPVPTQKPGTTTPPASTNPTPVPTATPTPSPTATPVVFYTLTVRNGSGSGSYPAGQQVIVIADDPASGKEFNNWTVDPTDVKVASKYVTATVVTMPAKDVLITANYKAKPSSGVVSNNNKPSSGSNGSAGNVGGTSGSTGNSGGSTSTNGTTVVINKNGLSNTGVVAVQVNGSSDNFVLKIAENTAATEAAIRALMTKYTDLSDIIYFPMDISLYDSTGTKLITDTTGLSINITLPIPDSMITYAGNNKVAYVADGRLKELPATFKTIKGVPCISFTATHFSPYVIYVDTNNLTAGVVNDSTPKTGDGIHPKWFLSIGLLCISMVLFLKKDKLVKENTKRAGLA